MIYLKTCSVGVKQQSLTHWQYGNAVIKFPIKYASHMNIVERTVTIFLSDFMYL